MPEPNIHEFNDKLAEVREWLVRIDTKVDYFNDVKTTAERADEKADEALSLAKENRAGYSGYESKYEMDLGRNDRRRWLSDIGSCAIFITEYTQYARQVRVPAGFFNFERRR